MKADYTTRADKAKMTGSEGAADKNEAWYLWAPMHSALGKSPLQNPDPGGADLAPLAKSLEQARSRFRVRKACIAASSLRPSLTCRTATLRHPACGFTHHVCGWPRSGRGAMRQLVALLPKRAGSRNPPPPAGSHHGVVQCRLLA